MRKNKVKLLSLLLVLILIMSTIAPNVLAATTTQDTSGVTVTSGDEAQSTLKSAVVTKKSYPYADRVKVNDLINYSKGDFVEIVRGKSSNLKQYVAGMDKKSNSKLKQLDGSNWYSTNSISYIISRLTFVPYFDPRATPAAPVSHYDEPVYYGEQVDEGTEEDMVDDYEAEPELDYSSKPKHSTTNVQVEGVDEADIIKTDGKHIFYLSSKGIAIVEANGGDPKQVASLKPNARIGQNLPEYKDLYISGDNLIVIAQKTNVNIFEGLGANQANLPNSLYTQNNSQFTSIDIFDISDAANPKLKRQVNIEGTISTTRLNNNSLYYVIDNSIVGYADSLVEFLPKYQDSLLGDEFYVLSPEDIYMSVYNSEQSISTQILGAISLKTETPISPKAYEKLAHSSVLYMNKDSMYLTSQYNSYNNKKYYPQPVDKSLTASVKPLYDETIKAERNTNSIISRFSFGENSVKFENMTRIWGTAANQFMFNVSGDVLRVVSKGHIKDDVFNTVLTLDAKKLTQTGRSASFGQYQAVTGTRFVGDIAYLSVGDSMLVFDLSSPTNPKKISEITTFTGAGYLHAFGSDYIIGIGTDIEDTYVKKKDDAYKQFGYRYGGVEFTLFDIRQPASPKVVDKLVVGSAGSSTIANGNPKTLMFDQETGVMTMPFEYNDFEIMKEGSEASENWMGGVSVEFSDEGIELGASFSLGRYYTNADSRFVYIGDTLYYVTAPYLVALDYETYKILNSLMLTY